MCGVIGVWAPTPETNIELLLLGVDYLERRGPEGKGFAVINPHRKVIARHSANTETELADFTSTAKRYGLETHRAQIALGQTRYITDGRPEDKALISANTQPIHIAYDGEHDLDDQGVCVQNGQIEHKATLEARIASHASHKADVDTRVLNEYIMQTIRKHGDEWKAIGEVMETLIEIDGAASVGFSSGESLLFFRDPQGYRPLVYGKIKMPGDDVASHVVVSETGFFEEIASTYGRECVIEMKPVQPGEMIRIGSNGELERRLLVDIRKIGKKQRVCPFEEVYLMDRFSANGAFNGACSKNRNDLGAAIAEFYKEELKGANVVTPVVNSGISYAEGAAHHLGIAYKSFLGKPQTGKKGERNFLLKKAGHKKSHKFVVNSWEVKDKHMVIVDDSVMRGDTIASIYANLKDAGAASVTVLAIWPPTVSDCYHGVDFKNKELIASTLVDEGIITYDQNKGIQYDIHQVNGRVSELIRDRVRAEFNGDYGDMKDLNIRYGTIEMLKANISTDENCFDCVDMSYENREVSSPNSQTI